MYAKLIFEPLYIMKNLNNEIMAWLQAKLSVIEANYLKLTERLSSWPWEQAFNKAFKASGLYAHVPYQCA